ncbi:MAG: DUF1287 domain-containing protein [Holophaga sp.]|nr:DUF1287 domain-containing protein [Holophaga sp.]
MRLAVILFSVLRIAQGQESGMTLVEAAKQQIGVTIYYDGSYRKLAYPGGDVPLERGVCTDVLIRAYRKIGIDLQVLVHRDMVNHWSAYPNPWRTKGPDRNIDHRRVPNLARFFARYGETLPISRDAAAFRAGDIVTWMLPGGLPHIGIVSDIKGDSGAPAIVHNIGNGTRIEDHLFSYKITGHFRYSPRA